MNDRRERRGRAARIQTDRTEDNCSVIRAPRDPESFRRRLNDRRGAAAVLYARAERFDLEHCNRARRHRAEQIERERLSGSSVQRLWLWLQRVRAQCSSRHRVTWAGAAVAVCCIRCGRRGTDALLCSSFALLLRPLTSQPHRSAPPRCTSHHSPIEVRNTQGWLTRWESKGRIRKSDEVEQPRRKHSEERIRRQLESHASPIAHHARRRWCIEHEVSPSPTRSLQTAPLARDLRSLETARRSA